MHNEINEGGGMIGIEGPWFVDEHGRTLMLRGVNLGGSSKVPRAPDGATHIREGFYDHRRVSFVGRPFALAEADEHFARLRRWGLAFLRFLVPWEAVEHEGPGQYDEEYLAYLQEVVARAEAHGISLFIDPHQDMWSRFCGGDGAPGWTLEAVGFDPTRFDETGAAITHQVHGDPFPRMIWPTNGGKLAAATMFTLFFGGNDFAPQTLVEGEPVQEYLQRHYIAAFVRVAERLTHLPNVAGFDTMNEPLPGYIGWKDLNAPGGVVTLGDGPTAFQGMVLGAGVPQDVGVFQMVLSSIRRTRTRRLNPSRASAWRVGCDCVWRANGVWDLDPSGSPVLLRPDHFARAAGRDIDFTQEYFRPFANRFARAIRSVDPDALIFLEGEPTRSPPKWRQGDEPRIVFAPHGYDDLVLVTKLFSRYIALDSTTRKLVFGRCAVRRALRNQLARLKQEARERLGGAPTLLAEFGIPFDLNGARAYRTGNFRAQRMALQRSFRAVEENLLDCTIWNYTADNTNARGDQWNGEDLSIFSRDQRIAQRGGNIEKEALDSGGRALEALVRPYPRATAGEPLRLSFDCARRSFEYEFRHDASIDAPTEIFVPNFQYPDGYRTEMSDGSCEVQRERQTLLYRHGTERREHTIRISPAPPSSMRAARSR